MVKRFKISEKGREIVKQAREKMGWKTTNPGNHEPLVAASKILNPDTVIYENAYYGEVYADGINTSSWKRFLEGHKVAERIFCAYCSVLKVKLKDVIDLSETEGSIPFVLLPIASDPQDASVFISVKIPDGIIMERGEEFIQAWKIRNTGNVIWKDRKLTRQGACKGLGLISSPRHVKISLTNPGESVEISVK